VLAHTRGGPVGVARVSGPVDAATRGGSIEVHEAGAKVVAESRGGPIEVSFTEVPEGSLETRGGSITVRIPSGAGVDLDAETAGGAVRLAKGLEVEGSTDSRRVVGRVNGGGPPLRLRTAGGAIVVDSR
jgi:hypothetical protein